MKDAYYFPHDSNARNDPKTKYLVSVYGMSGYGMYWVLIETLRDQDGFKLPLDDITISSLADDFRLSYDNTKQFIDDCINKFRLLKSDGQYIWSDSLMVRMQKMIESRQKRSLAGKKGMEKRWGTREDNIADNNDIAQLYQTNNNDITSNNKGKESKVNNNIYSSSSSYSEPHGKVFQFYEQNIGLISSHQSEVLNSYLNDGLEPELIVEAIKDSLGSDNKWKYLTGILEKCLEKKIYTLERYNTAKVEHKNKSKNKDPTIRKKSWVERKEEEYQRTANEIIQNLKKEGILDE